MLYIGIIFISLIVIGLIASWYSALLTCTQKKVNKFTLRTIIDIAILFIFCSILYAVGYFACSNAALDLLIFIIGRFIFLGNMLGWVIAVHPAITILCLSIFSIIFIVWKGNFDLTWQQVNQNWKLKTLIFIILCVGGANSIFSLGSVMIVIGYLAMYCAVTIGGILLHYPIIAGTSFICFIILCIGLYAYHKRSLEKAKEKKKPCWSSSSFRKNSSVRIEEEDDDAVGEKGDVAELQKMLAALQVS
jgi:hypothetical protein